jgi:hypothetical protein
MGLVQTLMNVQKTKLTIVANFVLTQKAIIHVPVDLDMNCMDALTVEILTNVQRALIIAANIVTIQWAVTTVPVLQDMNWMGNFNVKILMNVQKELMAVANFVTTTKAVMIVPVHRDINCKGAITVQILMNVLRTYQVVSRYVTILMAILLVDATMASGRVPPAGWSVMTSMNVPKTVPTVLRSAQTQMEVTTVAAMQVMSSQAMVTHAKTLMNVIGTEQVVSSNVTIMMEVLLVDALTASGKIPPTGWSVMISMNVLKTVPTVHISAQTGLEVTTVAAEKVMSSQAMVSHA